MVQPDDAVGTEPLLQPVFYLLLCQRLVAVGRQQTATGGKDGAAAVALDRAALEHEVEVVDVLTLYVALVIDAAVQGVVNLGGKLLAPPIELEIEQPHAALIVDQRDETVVACPRVIGGWRDDQ